MHHHPILLDTDMDNLEKKRHLRLENTLLLKKSIAASLVIFIIVFSFSKRHVHRKQIPQFALSTVFVDIPVTDSRGAMPRPPDLPQVPIPVEDDYVPPDATIPDTDFKIDEGIPLFDGTSEAGLGAGGAAPRPVVEAMPHYPQELREQGITGVVTLNILVNTAGRVDSVIVLGNSSGNRVLERYAKRAAYRTRYLPAKMGGDIVPFWIKRSYTFTNE